LRTTTCTIMRANSANLKVFMVALECWSAALTVHTAAV
jgi:hypothetical protein